MTFIDYGPLGNALFIFTALVIIIGAGRFLFLVASNFIIMGDVASPPKKPKLSMPRLQKKRYSELSSKRPRISSTRNNIRRR